MTLGVLISVMVIVLSAQRFGNVLDWAGPNVASNQIIVYTPNGPGSPGGPGHPITVNPPPTATWWRASAPGDHTFAVSVS